MKRPRKLLRLFASTLALCAGFAFYMAQASAARPEVWMRPPSCDNGRWFRELFEQPDEWKETRSLIDVLFYADHNLKRQFTDAELRKWFGQLNEWNLKFGMEVGAIKPWGLTGQACFSAENPNWDRLQTLGADLYAIAMDEPLLCCRQQIKKPDDYAVQETANYIALVRRYLPRIKVGDIETYPSIPLADHIWWLDALERKLGKMGVRGLDFYRLDVNWANFIVQNHGCWGEVRQIEQACRHQKLPFSLIYWASDLPVLERKGLAGESSWYLSIMHQGAAYAMVDGRPDQLVIESWLASGNPKCLPETESWTFTRSALDLTRRLMRAR